MQRVNCTAGAWDCQPVFCAEYGPQLWRQSGCVLIVLGLILVVVLDLSGLCQVGAEDGDEDD